MTKINHATNSLRDWLYDDRDALHPVIVINWTNLKINFEGTGKQPNANGKGTIYSP